MSAELIGILGVIVSVLGVGAALASLILTGKRDTDRRLADMDRRLVRVEGLLEGLGLSGRVAGAPSGG
ncbi:MAG: hypothetical protein OXN97_00235 [Bryobacterales bacterium]|nr:hypothetical protein [Bryobacterales bacterium]